jgi:hypothetical protein
MAGANGRRQSAVRVGSIPKPRRAAQGSLSTGPEPLPTTVGNLVPAFVFPISLHRQLVTISENERLHPFLLAPGARH